MEKRQSDPREVPPEEGVSARPADGPGARSFGPGGAQGSQMLVYATAAGLAAGVPVPLLDQMLSNLARGAALRRVASRHGMQLSPGARDALCKPIKQRATGRLPLRLVRAVAARLIAPLRVASRVDDALSTFAAALLLDHYLRLHARGGDVLEPREARDVRLAMESAEVAGVLGALKMAPRGFWNTVVDAADSVRGPDPEQRNAVERVVDALLDAAADAPGELGESLRGAFDAALERGVAAHGTESA